MNRAASKTALRNLLTENMPLIITEAGNREFTLGPVEPSPCTTACPAGINVKAYVSLMATGKFPEALEVIRERNPLPGICGRVCTHPCEAACNRNQVDQPVAVRWLKRFAADYELSNPGKSPQKIEITHPNKVAIIGSGPSGLTTANDLVRLGYDVTVFEALLKPGGMLIAGIPAFRLPRNILKAEIDYLKALGVNIETNHRIRGKNAIENLFDEGYAAVYLAIGAHKGKKLNIPGEDGTQAVLDAVDFLNQINFKNSEKPGDKIIVIGGGNSAIDSARTALRLGCNEVNILYRRTREEMPADEDEIAEAEYEGVKIQYLAAPVEILTKDGAVSGMKCLKMELGEPDESGRRRPVPIEGSEFVVDADVIIPAISQKPELDFELKAVKLSRWETLVADDITMATDRPGVFAGGDAVTGPSTVIDAIAAGHRAAEAIIHFLKGEPLTPEIAPGKANETEIKINFDQRLQKERATMPAMEIQERLANFEEVEFGFDEATAIAEAQRCLRCGPCTECITCVSLCDKQTMLMTIPGQTEEILCRIPAELQSKILTNRTLEATINNDNGSIPVLLRSLQPQVAVNICRGCGECVNACDYGAITLVPGSSELMLSQIDTTLCRSCGICVAACPNGAMLPGFIDDSWLNTKLNRIVPHETNLVVFSCRWNGSSLDSHGLGCLRTEGVNLHLIQTICGGRIEPGFVLKALAAGASGVLISSCADDDCHYGVGAKRVKSSFEEIKNLVHILGLNTERIGYAEIEAADSVKFIQTISEFASRINSLNGD